MTTNFKIKDNWSDSEMEEFDKEFEEYRVNTLNRKGKPYKYFSVGAELKYLEDKGIIKVDWKKPWLDVKIVSEVEEIKIKNNEKYEDFKRKLNFYFDWKVNHSLGKLGL